VSLGLTYGRVKRVRTTLGTPWYCIDSWPGMVYLQKG
jgi:hypothetical protein